MKNSYRADLLGLQSDNKIAKSASNPNVAKYVAIEHENGPRNFFREPFPLVAGTGFEPATSGL